MQISLLLMEEIAKLFAIMLMGYAVVKAGLMKSSAVSYTHLIDVQDPGNALDALMFVLAIDAEKCSRN